MGRKSIETTIEIDAPVEQVWDTLIDFPCFPEWSRFILSIEGDTRVGGDFKVRLDDGGGKPMTFTPVVLTFNLHKELRWRGFVGGGFLFSGEHSFTLSPLPGDQTLFQHNEVFGGLLLPFLWKTLNTRTRAAFVAFNESLKARVESGRSQMG